MQMRLGAKGTKLMKGYETGGIRPTRNAKMKLLPYGQPALTAYYDDVGVLTIGWGHTKGVKVGQTATLAQCEQWFVEDSTEFTDVVNRGIDDHPTTQDQFDAMVCLAFNIGPDFLHSTVLIRHNQGRYAEAMAAFKLWNKGRINGVLQVLKGLILRRADEAKIYSGKA